MSFSVQIGTETEANALNANGTEAIGHILFDGGWAVGQTILATPGATLLDKFTVYVSSDSGGYSSFRGFVLPWDVVRSRARGLLLYLSDPISPTVHESHSGHYFDAYTFTPHAKINPGQLYLTGITGALDPQTGTSAIAVTDSASAYPEGDLVQLGIPGPIGRGRFLLHANFRTWDRRPMEYYDLVFRATLTGP